MQTIMTESRPAAAWVYGTVNRKCGEKQEEGYEIILEVKDMFTILVMVSEVYIF